MKDWAEVGIEKEEWKTLRRGAYFHLRLSNLIQTSNALLGVTRESSPPPSSRPTLPRGFYST